MRPGLLVYHPLAWLFHFFSAIYWAIRMTFRSSGNNIFRGSINNLLNEEKEKLERQIQNLDQFNTELNKAFTVLKKNEWRITLTQPMKHSGNIFQEVRARSYKIQWRLKVLLGMRESLRFDLLIEKVRLFEYYVRYGKHENAYILLCDFIPGSSIIPYALLEKLNAPVDEKFPYKKELIEKLAHHSTYHDSEHPKKNSNKKLKKIIFLTVYFLVDVASTALTSLMNIFPLRIIGGALSAFWVLLFLYDHTRDPFTLLRTSNDKSLFHIFMKIAITLSVFAVFLFSASYALLHTEWIVPLLIASQVLYMLTNFSTTMMLSVDYAISYKKNTQEPTLLSWIKKGMAQSSLVRMISGSFLMVCGSIFSIVLLTHTRALIPFTNLWIASLGVYLFIYICIELYGHFQGPTSFEKIAQYQEQFRHRPVVALAAFFPNHSESMAPQCVHQQEREFPNDQSYYYEPVLEVLV